MNNKDIIFTAIQFIEDHLKEKISVLDMARSVHYSLYHFIRLFQSVTGFPPKTYLQQRRLTESVKELKHTDKKIIEIAFDFRFGSHEAYSRSFKKCFGISPKQIRDGFQYSTLPLVNKLSIEAIRQTDQARHIPPQLIELPQITLAGINFFISDDSKINDLSPQWNQFRNEVPSIENRITPERYYQVQYWSSTQELGGLYFFIGLEIEGTDCTAPQLVTKTLPASRYLRFIHKGLANMVGYTYKYIYNQYLPETDYQLTQPFCFELYGRKCLGPYNPESESEIYIPVK
jgi:AraC family transcriptional regulator